MAKRAKARPVARKSNQSKVVDEKHIGAEILSFEGIDTKAALIANFRHYNYFYDVKDGQKWAVSWAKKFRTPTEAKAIQAAPAWAISLTAASLCRMEINGCDLPKESKDFRDKKIEEVISRVKSAKKVAKAEPTVAKKSPAEIVKEKTSDMIAELDEIFDTLSDPKKYKDVLDFSTYDYLISNDTPYNTAKAIQKYFQPILSEFKDLVKGKDEDLNEGYSHIAKAHRNKILKFLQSMDNDCESFLNRKLAKRKPRVKKAASASKLVQNVKYLKESSEFKLTSVDPVAIVGAKGLIMFNTKSRRVIYLITNSSNGFSVKGTTIQNVDVENSFSKTIRKPDETLPKLRSTQKRVEKVLNDLTTKNGETNGRINADTIILKVFT